MDSICKFTLSSFNRATFFNLEPTIILLLSMRLSSIAQSCIGRVNEKTKSEVSNPDLFSIETSSYVGIFNYYKYLH